MTQLRVLNLQYQQQHNCAPSSSLHGTLFPEIRFLTQLTYLDLSANCMSGTIPSEISNLSNLRALYLNVNRFVGGLPTQLGLLDHSLQQLDLAYNRFSGTLPTEMGRMGGVYEILLNHNDLHGTVPKTWADMQNITKIALHGNANLTGPMPVELCAHLW
eukprot:CAMPEP_0116863314 /NCGR_PEP_ID=MMETSP0418-20121206/24150_1 /TAXON_ID=1158023 /ORGANISM="Astrosyne radiata, Strain 13vi08-1A" /LENGTH=158 /DNA_ID=CAMNT_0004498315 /DNA_START=78 /DNA_END=551 /DNA_ORIENTATION=-